MFRTDDKEYETLVVENSFVTDVQLVIERAMEDKGVSQADLARALKVSEARVSQILGGNGKNLQARTIARIAHVLNLSAVVEFTDICNACKKIDIQKWAKISTSENRGWNEIANENELEWAKAA